MEVKPGYKQTEVGVIPEEWESRELGDVFTLKSGFAFGSDFFSDTGPIVLTPGNFQLQGGLYFEERNTKRYSGSYDSSMTFNRGDLLIVMTDLTPDCNLLGKPAFVTTDDLLLHNQRIGKVVFKGKTTDAIYLFYVLLSRDYLGRIKGMATGSTVRHTSNKSIYGVPIPLPPLPEQRAIAGALSDVDALVGALDQLIAKKRDLKQAAMQQILTGKKRLPGFECGSRFKATDVGLIPEDWGLEAVGKISIVGRGRVISHREIAVAMSPLYPVYSSQTSNNGNMGYLDTFDFDGEYITWTTDGANAGTVFHRNGRFNCTNVCGTIKLKRDSASFVSKVLAGIAPRHVSRNLGNPKLMNGVMKRIQVPMPPSTAEQTAIAEVLSDMDAELAALEQRRDKTRALKVGMMQELLTGRTRLL